MNFKAFITFLSFQTAGIAYGQISTNPVRHQPPQGAGTVSTQPVRHTPTPGAGTFSTQPVRLPGSSPVSSGNRYILMMELSAEAEADLIKVAHSRTAMAAIMDRETTLLAKDIEKWIAAQGLSGKIKIADKLSNLGSLLVTTSNDVKPNQLAALQNAFKGRIGSFAADGAMSIPRPVRIGMGGAIGAAIFAGALATEAKAAVDKSHARAPSEAKSSVETEATDEFLH